jgi:hypothetical protein
MIYNTSLTKSFSNLTRATPLISPIAKQALRRSATAGRYGLNQPAHFAGNDVAWLEGRASVIHAGGDTLEQPALRDAMVFENFFAVSAPFWLHLLIVLASLYL